MSQAESTSLSGAHRKYIWAETMVGAVFNTVISIIFAFLVARGVDAVPLWGAMGMAVDFVPTVFMITLVTTLIVTLLARKRLAQGKAPALPRSLGGPLGWAPRAAVVRGLIYALLFTIVLVPLSIGALIALNATAMPVTTFVVFKALYGLMLSLLIGPPITRAALAR